MSESEGPVQGGPRDTPPPAPPSVTHLADSLERLVRLFARTRAQMVHKMGEDQEWSALVLMSALVAHAPLRLTALAELVHSDTSTVSRQVAQLVREGFVERHADAEDGRASLLVPTEAARTTVARRKRSRDVHFELMLRDWDAEACERLAALLTRFTDDFEDYKHTLAGTDWDKLHSAGREEIDT